MLSVSAGTFQLDPLDINLPDGGPKTEEVVRLPPFRNLGGQVAQIARRELGNGREVADKLFDVLVSFVH